MGWLLDLYEAAAFIPRAEFYLIFLLVKMVYFCVFLWITSKVILIYFLGGHAVDTAESMWLVGWDYRVFGSFFYYLRLFLENLT